MFAKSLQKTNFPFPSFQVPWFPSVLSNSRSMDWLLQDKTNQTNYKKSRSFIELLRKVLMQPSAQVQHWHSLQYFHNQIAWRVQPPNYCCNRQCGACGRAQLFRPQCFLVWLKRVGIVDVCFSEFNGHQDHSNIICTAPSHSLTGQSLTSCVVTGLRLCLILLLLHGKRCILKVSNVTTDSPSTMMCHIKTHK